MDLGPLLGVSIGGAFALGGSAALAYRKVKGVWDKRVNPFLFQLQRGLIVLNGRPAVTLPEDPEVVVAPPIKGVLQRMDDVEQTQGNQIIHLGQHARALNSISGEVTEIKDEVQHNHGGSLKDAVKRIEEMVASNTAHLSRIDVRLEEGNDRFGGIEDVLSTQKEADIALYKMIEAVAKAEPPHDVPPLQIGEN